MVTTLTDHCFYYSEITFFSVYYSEAKTHQPSHIMHHSFSVFHCTSLCVNFSCKTPLFSLLTDA